jgi:hypothetical protein
MTENTITDRDGNGRFQAGQSGNPAGRPRGARNRAGVLAEMLEEGEDARILRVVVEKALAGDAVAARFCADRLVSKPRGRPISLSLPEGATAADVLPLFEATLHAMATGEISPEEAAGVTHVLEGRKRALEIVRLEKRMGGAEDRVARLPSPVLDASGTVTKS